MELTVQCDGVHARGQPDGLVSCGQLGGVPLKITFPVFNTFNREEMKTHLGQLELGAASALYVGCILL